MGSETSTLPEQLIQLRALLQFNQGTSLIWNALLDPLPMGIMLFSTDDGVFKLGDGVTLYGALPALFTYADLVAAQGVNDLFIEPEIADNGKIVVVALDEATDMMKYSISDTSLNELLTLINVLENNNTTIAELLALALSIDVSITTSSNNNLILVDGLKYVDSGSSITDIQTQIAEASTYVPGSHLEEVVFYSTQDRLNVVDKAALFDNVTYYADVIGFNNTAEIVYALASGNPNIIITQIEGSLFSVALNGVSVDNRNDTPAILIASINTAAGTSLVKKAVSIKVLYQRIISSIYGGSGYDYFYGVTVDSTNNIICAGYTTSEGLGSYDALVVKFDPNLTILARKRYGGSGYDYFWSIAIDSTDNIICVGSTTSEGSGGDALVVKFDSSLTILARKVYGGSGYDYFNGVTVDSSDNIICAGSTASEGAGSDDALIVKFDSSLTILARKVYGGSGNDYFYGVAVDSSDNIICVGSTNSEGAGSYDGFVVKFDPNLTILARKRYGGSGNDIFYGVTVDSSDNIICAGVTSSEGSGSNDALVVKLDNSFTILARKVYGGINNDYFQTVGVDSSDNIICAGYTNSEGAGSDDTLVIKYDSDLAILARKVYGGSGGDYFYSVAVDSSDNIICVGNTTSEGSGGDALVVKFPSDIPEGTFTGAVLTGLTMADSTLTLADSALTLADSALTLADSALTLADSTLTLANSTLTQESEIILT